nr:MAG TPA: hypothetical protein [Caudoviricetes sp.]
MVNFQHRKKKKFFPQKNDIWGWLACVTCFTAMLVVIIYIITKM